jgi:FixJ family two-component response regulator
LSSPQNQKKTVVIIDDNSAVRRAIKDLLSAFGYITYIFGSAEAFLLAARASKADCLVVDVDLGDISGIELGRRLAEKGYKFPIIFVCARDDEVIRNQAAQLGCIAYLQKPFTADELIAATVRAVGQALDPSPLRTSSVVELYK